MAHRTACALRIVILFILIGTARLGGVVQAQEPGAGRITVLIGNMQYEGKDAYSLVVSTSNVSSKDVLIRIIEENFFIQTDRGWAQLRVLKGINHESAEFLLPGAGNNDRPASITIPPTVPDLFRTYEGDLSLMYKYTYSVRTVDGTGAAFQRTDEVYGWMKPGTSQWILREGM
jgi:hypothetical protein